MTVDGEHDKAKTGVQIVASQESADDWIISCAFTVLEEYRSNVAVEWLTHLRVRDLPGPTLGQKPTVLAEDFVVFLSPCGQMPG
jgi:hypothetical protein